MKIIIAGAGSVGRYMAEQLSKFGHNVVLIDTSAKAVGRVDNESGNIVGLVGDGCEVSTLANAGAKDADVIAAVTGDDEDNLVISLLAKQEFGVHRGIHRVNNTQHEWTFTDM